MSLQDALSFITAARANPALLRDFSALKDCLPIGKRLGLDFSLEEIRDAHSKDWGLRWFHFRKSPLPRQNRDASELGRDGVGSDIFARIASELPPALFDASVGRKFEDWARSQPPASWLGFVGFECPLGLANPRIDFHREITAGEDAIAFADSLSGGEHHSAAIEALRKRLEEFCRRWSRQGSPLYGNVSDIILEFDMLEFDMLDDPRSVPPPAIFLATRHQNPPYKLSLDDSLQVAISAGELLAGRPPSDAVMTSLTRCLENCPSNALITHLAVMLSRSGETIRLNIKDLMHDQFLPYLEAIGWKGPHRAIEDLLADTFARVDHITLAIDVGTSIGDAIGLECTVDGAGDEWRPMLDHLVASGLASPSQRDALIAWPSLITPLDAANAWPDHLVLDSMRRPTNEFSRFRRYLSHIKVSWNPDLPLRAKAYLGINHRWMKQEQSGKTMPWQDPIYSIKPATSNGGKEDQTHHIAIAKAIGYLMGSRGQGGWWKDFSLKDPGEEYVTAFVATALAQTRNEDAVRAARWAWRLLSRRDHFMSGWAWNRHSPPDADSTAWGLRLAQVLCAEDCDRIPAARSFLIKHRQPDGGVASYIDWEKSALSTDGRETGWRQSHICVTAAAAGVTGLTIDCRDFLRSVQRPDGRWQAYWWSDDEFTTALAAEALFSSCLEADRAIIGRATQWVLNRLSPQGFVRSISGAESAFCTAWCLRILALDSKEPRIRSAMLQSVRWLIDNQRDDGSWKPSALMRIPPRETIRPTDGQGNINLIDLHANFTTAAVLAALVSASRDGVGG